MPSSMQSSLDDEVEDRIKGNLKAELKDEYVEVNSGHRDDDGIDTESVRCSATIISDSVVTAAMADSTSVNNDVITSQGSSSAVSAVSLTAAMAAGVVGSKFLMTLLR